MNEGSDTFAPADDERRSGARRVSARRVFVRFAAALVALVALDAGVRAVFPEPAAGPDWRMPRTMPTAEIDAGFRRLLALARADRPVVAFVGASPAWGHAVRDPSQTVPARFARVSRATRTPAKTVNLACSGQLPADSYSVALKAAEHADLVVVQLTYHAFNPDWRQGTEVRYPELPKLLGVRIDDAFAKTVGLDATSRVDVTGAVDRGVRRTWALYGARDRIAARTFGTPPEERAYAEWERLSDLAFAGEETQLPSGKPFEQLEPDEQMFILDEFSSASDYRFRPDDAQAVALERLAAKLQAEGRRAVFYVSPLNVDALKEADLYDAVQMTRNVEGMRALVERHGHQFIDLSREPLPEGSFADINHTTALGSDVVARTLWREFGGRVSFP